MGPRPGSTARDTWPTRRNYTSSWADIDLGASSGLLIRFYPTPSLGPQRDA